MNNLLFYSLLLISIIFSLAVITSRNPVHSILSLILVFLNIASFLILLGAEFLALLFIIVYVGAVAVLFLFIIMMLNIKFTYLSSSMFRCIPTLIIFSFVFLLIFGSDSISLNVRRLFLLSFFDYFLFDNFMNNWYLLSHSFNNLVVFSSLIYTNYFLSFIISGIILLVSMIGSISLTLHKRNDVKRQCVYKQLNSNFYNSIAWKT